MSGPAPADPAPGRAGAGRLVALDLARSAALAAMAVFHFTFDLEMFGLIAAGTIWSSSWQLFAKAIAASFLFIAGLSLWLAHGGGFRAGAFWRRWGRIAAAAALITAVTRVAIPDQFIFYGILHSIAVASLAGLVFLRTPWWATLAAAGAALVLPRLYRSEAFDGIWLVWTGLAERLPATADFEPFFPWVAPFLAGLAAAQLAWRNGQRRSANNVQPGLVLWWLSWPGRHSLAVYLLHQPVLLSVVWLFAGMLRG